jgi:glycerol kinase
VWSSQAELAATWRLDRRFRPEDRDERGYARWRAAVPRTQGWASQD